MRERWLGEDGRAALADVREALAALESFDEPTRRRALEAVVARRAVKPREVYQPLRVALTGTTISPGIFESVALLGREETLARIDRALATRRDRRALNCWPRDADRTQETDRRPGGRRTPRSGI